MYITCFIIRLSSPSNNPLSIAIKDENVPPRAVAIAHILMDEARLIMVLSGGLSVIIAPTPAKTLAPTTTPKEIKKLFIVLVKKLDNVITIPYKNLVIGYDSFFII